MYELPASIVLLDLFILFAAHCIGDYPLQSEFLSKFKSSNLYILICHCAIYTLIIMIAFYCISINSTYLNYDGRIIADVVFITHILIDKAKCIYRSCLQESELNTKKDIYGFYVDQGAHMIILFLLYFTLLK